MARQFARQRGDGGPRIHIIGHSTGGLDARLLANPRYRFHGEDPSCERSSCGGADCWRS